MLFSVASPVFGSPLAVIQMFVVGNEILAWCGRPSTWLRQKRASPASIEEQSTTPSAHSPENSENF